MRSEAEEWELAGEDVDIWLADLEALRADLTPFAGVLDRDEQARAARFYFAKDREHFIAARGALRMLLGRYLEMAPEQVKFSYNDHGKPRLAGGLTSLPLEFNLSHSHGLALYGFTLARSIGIDVEQVRDNLAVEELAQRFFSKAEVEELKAAPKEARLQLFFNGWSRKEAFIKAKGIGLSLGLERFSVRLANDRPALLHMEGQPEAAERWTICEVRTREGYVGALALEGHIGRLRWREFQ